MDDFRNWSRGSDLPGYADDDHEFPRSCININDHAEAIQCWGLTEAEAAQRRNAIMLAVESYAQLTAENAALRADLNDARSNWESGAEELRQADAVREQHADLLLALQQFVHPYQQQFKTTEAERMQTARDAIERAMAGSPTAVDVGDLDSTLPKGTFACSICGHDEPHGHSEERVAAYRADQIRNDGWTSAGMKLPKESGWYLCSGIKVLGDEGSQLHWFKWVRDFMAGHRSDIPEVLYFDVLYQSWLLRNALGNALYSGEENRKSVAAAVTLWREVPAVNKAAVEAPSPTANGAAGQEGAGITP